MKKALMVLAAMTVISGCDSSDVKKAKDEVAYNLNDPSSVQWRNVEKVNDSLICGEYNAKNSYGAYSGFKRFAKFGDQILIDDEKVS